MMTGTHTQMTYRIHSGFTRNHGVPSLNEKEVFSVINAVLSNLKHIVIKAFVQKQIFGSRTPGINNLCTTVAAWRLCEKTKHGGKILCQ